MIFPFVILSEGLIIVRVREYDGVSAEGLVDCDGVGMDKDTNQCIVLVFVVFSACCNQLDTVNVTCNVAVVSFKVFNNWYGICKLSETVEIPYESNWDVDISIQLVLDVSTA